MGRTLRLRRETLATLETDELARVAGAEWTPWCPFIIELRETVERLLETAACR
jgi:hypothetical protein